MIQFRAGDAVAKVSLTLYTADKPKIDAILERTHGDETAG